MYYCQSEPSAKCISNRGGFSRVANNGATPSRFEEHKHIVYLDSSFSLKPEDQRSPRSPPFAFHISTQNEQIYHEILNEILRFCFVIALWHNQFSLIVI